MKVKWIGMAAMCVVAPMMGADTTSPTGEAPANPEVLYIDHMENVSKNDLGGRNSVYIQAPSRSAFSKAGEYGKGDGNSGLKIVYDKKNEGGPRGDGGFCGFYTLVKHGPEGYLDATAYKYLTFWVRGDKGGENFKVGAADKMWEAMDDSVKSQEIGKYLAAGKVTTDWQLAVIPVDEFLIDWKQMHAFSICFETDLFADGSGQGTVFIDEMALMKQQPPEKASK